MKQFTINQLVLALSLSSTVALTGCVKRPPDPPADQSENAAKPAKAGTDLLKKTPTADEKDKSAGNELPAQPADRNAPVKPGEENKSDSAPTTAGTGSTGSKPSTSSGPTAPGKEETKPGVRAASDKPSREEECEKPKKLVADYISHKKNELLNEKSMIDRAQTLRKSAEILNNAVKSDADFAKKAKELSEALQGPQTTSAADSVPKASIPELGVKLATLASQALKDGGMDAGNGNIFFCSYDKDNKDADKEVHVICPIQPDSQSGGSAASAKDDNFDGVVVTYSLDSAIINLSRGLPLAKADALIKQQVLTKYVLVARETTGFASKAVTDFVETFNGFILSAGTRDAGGAVIRFGNQDKDSSRLDVLPSMAGDEKLAADKREKAIQERFEKALGIPASCYEAVSDDQAIEHDNEDAVRDDEAKITN